MRELGSIPAEAEDICLCKSDLTGCGANPTSISMGMENKVSGMVKVTTHY